MRQLVIGYTKMCLKETDYENRSLMELLRIISDVGVLLHWIVDTC
jgi:hypothetical protein